MGGLEPLGGEGGLGFEGWGGEGEGEGDVVSMVAAPPMPRWPVCAWQASLTRNITNQAAIEQSAA
jgi:hypothetical protein